MDTPSLGPVTFVLGAPRSGTTLLRVMLAGHPQLWSPPEMVLAPFETMAERRAKLEERFWEKGGLRRGLMDLRGIDIDQAKAAVAAMEGMTIPEVYAQLQSELGGRMLVDKCPHLAASPEALPRLAAWFPEARWIWIVRHPGSVLRSLENMPMAEVMLSGYPTEPRELWRYANEQFERFLDTQPRHRWIRVRYEDIVSDGRPVMEAVCRTLGLPFDEAMLNPYEGDRMREGTKGARAIGDPNMAGYGKIRPELATKWLAGFDPRSVSAATRQYAKRMGYDLDAAELPPIARVTDAFGALLDTARELEASISMPSDLDAVEGRRFLLRMVSASVDTFVEQGDPNHPELHHSESPHRKMFGDNPDADYLRASIRTAEGQVYRVSGVVPPGTLYAGVQLYRRGGQVGNHFTDQQLGVGEDGRFELLVSKDPQPGVWLQAHGDETALIVRQYFADRSKEPPVQVDIARVDVAPAPAILDPSELAVALDRARRMLKVTFERTVGAYKMVAGMALNRFVEIPGEGLFPTPDNIYQACWYRFGQDQVMFIRGKMPRARYVSFTLYNAWLESLDYTQRTVCMNHSRIQTDDDGNFEISLSHSDLGHPNRLDVAGHHAGYVVLRALLPEEPLPALEIQVMYEREYAAKGG